MRLPLPLGALVRLLWRLAPVLLDLGRARRQALRGFRKALREAGVPAEAIPQLEREYPALTLRDLASSEHDHPRISPPG